MQPQKEAAAETISRTEAERDACVDSVAVPVGWVSGFMDFLKNASVAWAR